MGKGSLRYLAKAGRRLLCEKSRARIRMDLNEYQEKALKTAVYPAG